VEELSLKIKQLIDGYELAIKTTTPLQITNYGFGILIP